MMKTRQAVKVIDTESSLDGRTGLLLGKSVNGLVHIWIVGLDAPFIYAGEEYLAVTLPGSCLEIIENPWIS